MKNEKCLYAGISGILNILSTVVTVKKLQSHGFKLYQLLFTSTKSGTFRDIYLS